MDRSCLVAETIFNGESFLVATTHLESMDCKKQRSEQIYQIQHKILKGRDAIFMGDLNFDFNWYEEGKNIDHTLFTDLWTNLRDEKEEAYTMNGTSRLNPVILDHVLLAKDSQFKPKFIERVGNY